MEQGDDVPIQRTMWIRVAAVLLLALLAVPVSGTASAGAAEPGDALNLVRSYLIPASEPEAATIGDRGWTYDSAVTAAAYAATGQAAAAEPILDDLAALQQPDGALGFSYDVRTGSADMLARSGAIAWVGIAAAQYRTSTCSPRYDGLMAGVAHWLLAHRITDPASRGYGFVPGGPDVSWISAEHNFEARALYARAAALINGTVGTCAGGLAGVGQAEAAQLAADLHQATVTADAAIQRELFVREGPRRAHLNQGVGDGARPIDAQALGTLWLIGQGRRTDATSVITAADSEMLLTRRWFEGHPEAGRFTGYKPYAEAWGPDVLWMEGTLQMRMAKAAAGVSTDVIDENAARWATLGTGGLLPQADRTLVGNPAGDYHTWPAAAPAAWLRLASSGSTILS
ncbi:hypothetical protein [Capillimicrobium parvum]|uniref:Alginate lyase domain-containing protein n=1 Tax=Capillimicrobium parvum TaxID=2884022 RepID=A0A9E6XY09_9ACTN|nr:hypothetical protein [Capillimicrobium parvum]UGS36594.1 hypothetical protein DSM104329_03002 [Capillimicrobium parvum]